MLELTRPFGAPPRPYVSAQITTALARERWELSSYWALRRAIFCEETALFTTEHEERDAHDERALPIVALAHSAGTPDHVAGIVRIYEASPGVWFGGRLGVDRAYRSCRRVGVSLVRTAVETAVARGAERFYATVLEANARYFERLAFVPEANVVVCGRPHVLMQATLARYGGAVRAATRNAA